MFSIIEHRNTAEDAIWRKLTLIHIVLNYNCTTTIKRKQTIESKLTFFKIQSTGNLHKNVEEAIIQQLEEEVQEGDVMPNVDVAQAIETLAEKYLNGEKQVSTMGIF